MECLVCSEVTEREKRLVCVTCLKPTCVTCFAGLETKVCPNCREKVFYPLKVKNHNGLIRLMNRNMNPLCMIGDHQCSEEVLDLVDDGHGVAVFSCQRHSFDCINCCQRKSLYAVRVCEGCRLVHCNKCVRRLEDRILCFKCDNRESFRIPSVVESDV